MGFSLFHSCLSCLFNFKEAGGFTRGGNVETLKRGGGGGGTGGRVGRKQETQAQRKGDSRKLWGGGKSFSLFFFLFGGIMLLVFDVKREGFSG